VNYSEAENLLKLTFSEVKHQHPTPAGQNFISTHWRRYVNIIQSLPPLTPESKVLEIGASIMSTVLRNRFKVEMVAACHELETEWPARFAEAGIKVHPVELMRDLLPFAPQTFDVILFDEVMEHFPLTPDFFFKQLFTLLKPQGQLIFSVPNFATYKHRLDGLMGLNPQDVMHDTFIYYSHHREPVMHECITWVENNGGKILEKRWSDYLEPLSFLKQFWYLLRYLKHGEIHKIVHALVPSTRYYIFIRAQAKSPLSFLASELTPPLAKTKEYER
jgi:2-polyprenyl-3-methyl-5-hydroxy-6-metoxy-1,4-benzoquinol methylase